MAASSRILTLAASFPRLRTRSSIACTSTPPLANFLEQEDDEYLSVVLPTREPKPYIVPWPTLLAPSPSHTDPVRPSSNSGPVGYLSPSVTSALSRMRDQGYRTPCDALLQLVKLNDFSAARQMMGEFKDLHIPVQPDETYLQAALDCFKEGNSEAGLSFFTHFPSVPLQYESTPRLEKKMKPLVDVLYEKRHTDDQQFLDRFLTLAARKGLLSIFIKRGILLAWIQLFPTVQASWSGINRLVEEIASTRGISLEPAKPAPKVEDSFLEDPDPTMSQEEVHGRKIIRFHGSKLRNILLRHWLRTTQLALSSNGPNVAARDLAEQVRQIYLAGMKSGIKWEIASKLGMMDVLKSLEVKERHDKQSRYDSPPAGEYLHSVVTRTTSQNHSHPQTLPRTILLLAHTRARDQPLSTLTNAIIQLESQGRFTLLNRLSKRFLDRGSSSRSNLFFSSRRNKTTNSIWRMAQVKKYALQGEPALALAEFKMYFYWMGLPSLDKFATVPPPESKTSSSNFSSPSSSRRHHKLVPSRQTITQLYSIMLQNLIEPSQKTIMDLHLLAVHAFPPAPLLLDPPTTLSGLDADGLDPGLIHLPFLIALIKLAGPTISHHYILRREKEGMMIGVQSWTALATEYARLGYSSRANKILQMHSSGDSTEKQTARRPQRRRGNRRMYLAVASMYQRVGRTWRAKEVLGLMQGRPMKMERAMRRAYRARKNRRLQS